MSTNLKNYIRDIQDFPKKGIVFKDITPLLADENAFKRVLDVFVERYQDKGIDKVLAADARGFMFGGAIAYMLGAGFVPVRKKGKLPYRSICIEYDLEYGSDALCVHEDAISPGERILIMDDLLATGGTAKAMCDIVKQLKGDIVELAFLIELGFLNGRDKIKDYSIFSQIIY